MKLPAPTCPCCGGEYTHLYPLTRQLLAGHNVAGYYLGPMMRRVLGLMMSGTYTLDQLAARAYVDADGGALTAKRTISVLECRMRKQLGADVVPICEGYGGIHYARADLLEARLVANLKDTAAVRQAILQVRQLMNRPTPAQVTPLRRMAA